EAGQLGHGCNRQGGPRLTGVGGDEGERREVEHHVVDELHVLAGHLDARPGHAGAHEDRDVELAALGVDGVEAPVVDRHLRNAAGRAGRHRLDAVRLVVIYHLADVLTAHLSTYGHGWD